MRVLQRTYDVEDDVRVAAGLTPLEAEEMAERLNEHANLSGPLGDASPSYYFVEHEEHDLNDEHTRSMLEIVLGSARVTEMARA